MTLSQVAGRQARLEAQRASDREEYDPTKGMSTIEKLAVGNTAAWKRAGRSAVNLVLPDHLTPEWASDEAIQEQDATDAPLLRTGAGLTGNLIGSLAATAPISGAAGGVLKAATAASRAGRTAPLISRVLGSRPAIAGVEGAVQGALLSDPNERGEDIAQAGGLSAGLSALGGIAGAGGRVLRKALKIDISDEAAQLQKIMSKYAEEAGDEFIPLSQAAKPGLGRQLYEGVIANIPGAGQKLRGQYERALSTFRETAMARSLPHGVKIDQVFRRGDDIQTGFARMSEAWDDAFKAVNKMDVKVRPNFMPKAVREAIEELGSYKVPTPKNGVLKGQDLVDMKEAIQAAINRAPKGIVGKGQRDVLIKARDNLEIAIMRQLRVGQRAGVVTKGSARGRQFNLGNYGNWRKLRSAAESAGGDSMFTPRQLLNRSSRGRHGIEGRGGRLQELGKLGKEALQPFPSRQGIFQTVAALGVAGAGAAGAAASDNPIIGGLAGLAIPIMGARGLARPGVQRFLSGQTQSPNMSAMVAALRRTGMTARQAAVAANEILENEDAP